MPKDHYIKKRTKSYYNSLITSKTPPPSFEVLDDILIFVSKNKKCKNFHGKWFTQLNNSCLACLKANNNLTESQVYLIERIFYLRSQKLKVNDFVYRNRTVKPLDYLLWFGKHSGKFISEIPQEDLLVEIEKLSGKPKEIANEVLKGNKDFYRPQVISI